MADLADNFRFLSEKAPLAVKLARQAEAYFVEDPCTSLIKMRQFGEILTQHIQANLGLPPCQGQSFADSVNSLRATGSINGEVAQGLHLLRSLGNQAVHENKGSHQESLQALKVARALAVWFHRVFTDKNFSAGPFVPPTAPASANVSLKDELTKLKAELQAALAQAEEAQLVAKAEAEKRAQAEATAQIEAEEKAALKALADQTQEALKAELARQEELLAEVRERVAAAPETLQTARAAANTIKLELDEAATRQIIDQQLREAGWEANTKELRYESGARPEKGKNRAIAEWPTANGPADYVLFVGLMPVAVVEAKRARKNVAATIEQSRRYSEGYTVQPDQASPGGPWGQLRVPFLFATNGRPYLEQIKEQCGIWFLDGRRPQNHPKPLEGWHTPDGLISLLNQDIDQADAALTSEPKDYLPLRDYQKDALTAVEGAIAAGQDSILVAMATGTGKTMTCVCMLYRFLKAKRFRRILFLVDRSALGEQAANAFKFVRLEGSNFSDIYQVKEIGDLLPDPETRVHISTVQAMVKRVLYPGESADVPPVDQYDCIIIDECHRGYTLDREMSDAELTFRSESDYISVYRRVLEHFDAVRIGLTATPALHTVQIFGKPVFNYSYRQAIIEGWLIDHDPPYQITTRLAEDGMAWARGEQMEVFRPREQRVDLVNLPDDVTLELDSFNREVLTDNFNRAVCKYLATQIDPDLDGKTLIFCVNDEHADKVVRILKEEMDKAWGGVNDQAIQKITGAADKPAERIRRFKNEKYPSIAVTVDLLTTGIDVPQIVNLVFLRRIKSRILYDQMMGRATRLCPDIGKESFKIYDAVKLYEGMQDYSDMKPVVVQPNLTFSQLVAELESAPEDHREVVLEQLVAKLQRKKGRLSGDGKREFETRTGMTMEQFINDLRGKDTAAARQWFEELVGLANFLDTVTGEGQALIVSHHEDEVRRVERGYGPRHLRPGDYLEEFKAYLAANLNEIPALIAVTQRPRELTRKQLIELQKVLSQAGFTERELESAWKETTNQEVAARIIGFIRQRALGSPLVPYADRVERALRKILEGRTWTDPQKQWLQRLARQMKDSTVIDRETLDSVPVFSNAGGFSRIDRVFGGQLGDLLGEFQELAWEDEAA